MLPKSNESKIALLIVAIGLGLIFFLYLGGNIIGDQLGLWSYIYSQEHDHPFGLWNERASSGVPQSLNPEYQYLETGYVLSILVGDPVLRSNLYNIITLAVLCLGVFLLTRHLTGHFYASLIAGCIAIASSGASIRTIGNHPYFFPMALMPFLFLFLLKLLEKPRYTYAFALASTLALIILSGGVATLFWLAFFMPFFILFYFFLYFKRSLLARQIIFLSLAAVLFGLFIFFKIWAGLLYSADTNLRPSAQPYELFVQGRGIPGDMPATLLSIIIRPALSDHIGLWIGPLGLLLLIFSFKDIKKKQYLLFLFLVILSVMVILDTFVTRMAYGVPYLNKTKDVVKSLFLLGPCIGVLCGYGFIRLEKILKGCMPGLRYLPHALLVLVFVQFAIFFIINSEGMISPDGKNVGAVIANDTFFMPFANSEDTYRMSYQDFNGGSLQLRLNHNHIAVADWIQGNGFSTPFLMYKQVVASTRTDELLGVLNVKYIYSKNPLDRPTLQFVKTANGEYLYENTAYMSRHRLVPHAILVYPASVHAQQTTYALLTQPEVNLSNTIVISSPALPPELSRFDLVLLTAQPSADDINALRTYSASGGKIYPDIFSTNLSFPQVMDTFTEPSIPVSSAKYGTDSLSITSANSGWIFLSETYAAYSGWEAYNDGSKIPIYSADGILSAVYLQKPGTITFVYRPAPFTIGLPLSLLFFAISAGTLILSTRFWKKKVK